MRIVLPRIASQKIVFSQNFHNLNYVYGSNGIISGTVSVDKGLNVSSGGYVYFGSYGADIVWSLSSWSVSVDVIVPALGSQLALVSCGNSTAGNRFELGIQTTGAMYATGIGTINSNSLVSPGRHELLWSYNNGSIAFFCDGLRLGVSPFDLGVGNPNTLLVGVASDETSRKWGSTVYNLDVYSYPIDFLDPTSLWSATEPGFWADLDSYAAIERNTQPEQFKYPTIYDMDFNAATTVAFTESSVGVTSKVAGEYGNALRVTGANAYAQQLGFISGNRYNISDFIGRGDGTSFPRIDIGGVVGVTGTISSAWHALAGNVTSGGSTLRFVSGAAGASDFDSPTVGIIENYSVTSVKCKGALGDLAQTTAANMPWETTLGSKKSIYCATNDGMILGTDKTTQKHFHDGTGVTFSFVFKSSLSAGNEFFFCSAGNSTNIGMFNYVTTAGIIYSFVVNGSGTYVFVAGTAAGTVAPNTPCLITIRHNISGVEIYADGILAGSDYTKVGVHSTDVAASLISPTSYVGGISYACEQIADPYSVAKYVTDQELEYLHRFFADKHGLKLATDTLTEAELETWDGLVSWVDPLSAVIGYNTQPVIANVDFSAGGTGWTITPATWTFAAGLATHVSGNVNSLYQISMIPGNRTRYDWSIIGGIGEVGNSSISSPARSVTGTYTEEGTQTDALFRATPSNFFTGSVDSFSNVTNLSIASIPERVGGGTFAQATAANMPWVDSTTGAIQFDGTADLLTSNRAASTFYPLHTGNCELITVANITNTTTNGYLFDTFNTDGIILLQVAGSNRLKCVLRNDSGAYDLLEPAPGSITPLTPQIYGMSILGASAYLYVNTSVVDTEAFTADAGVSKVASIGATLAGTINETLAFSRTLSGSERYRLRVMLAAKHSITLP